MINSPLNPIVKRGVRVKLVLDPMFEVGDNGDKSEVGGLFNQVVL